MVSNSQKLARVLLGTFAASATATALEHFLVAPRTDPDSETSLLCRYASGVVAIFVPATIGAALVETAPDAIAVYWAGVAGAAVGTKLGYLADREREHHMVAEVKETMRGTAF